jgi:hypothetical protein
MVGRGHGGTDLGVRFVEGDVTLDAAGPDSALAGAEGPLEPWVLVTVGGAHAQAFALADHPDWDEPPQAAVLSSRGDLELRRTADPLEFVRGPRADLVAYLTAARYSASVTWSPQSDSGPAAGASQIAKWVMK